MKLGKTLKNMGNVLAKIVKKSIFSKIKLNQFTSEETNRTFLQRIVLYFKI